MNRQMDGTLKDVREAARTVAAGATSEELSAEAIGMEELVGQFQLRE